MLSKRLVKYIATAMVFNTVIEYWPLLLRRPVYREDFEEDQHCCTIFLCMHVWTTTAPCWEPQSAHNLWGDNYLFASCVFQCTGKISKIYSAVCSFYCMYACVNRISIETDIVPQKLWALLGGKMPPSLTLTTPSFLLVALVKNEMAVMSF